MIRRPNRQVPIRIGAGTKGGKRTRDARVVDGVST
jgi:hypothetical protein